MEACACLSQGSSKCNPRGRRPEPKPTQDDRTNQSEVKDEKDQGKNVYEKPSEGNEFRGLNYARMGDLYMKKGNLGLAIESYKLCLSCDPSNNEIRNFLAQLSKKQVESNINLNLGNIKLAQGDIQSALHFFIDAKEANPSNVEAWINLGLVYRSMKAFDSSISCYQKAISFDVVNQVAYYNLGCTLHDMARLDEAIDMYKLTLEVNSTHRDALFNLGVAYYELGNQVEAVAHLKRTLLIDPTFGEAQQALQRVQEGTFNLIINSSKKQDHNFVEVEQKSTSQAP